MSSITLHDLNDSLYAALQKMARKEGKSMNRTIKGLLEESLGLKHDAAANGSSAYSVLCGAMPAEEAERMLRFEDEEMETIDDEAWL